MLRFCLEGQENRRAGGYLTRLQSEHLFQILFLGCKNGLRSLFFFFSSLTSFSSSLWLSNTVLASWKRWMWDKGRTLGAVGGAGGSRQGCLQLCICYALPISHLCFKCRMFLTGAGLRFCSFQELSGEVLRAALPSPSHPISSPQDASAPGGCMNLEAALQWHKILPL